MTCSQDNFYSQVYLQYSDLFLVFNTGTKQLNRPHRSWAMRNTESLRVKTILLSHRYDHWLSFHSAEISTDWCIVKWMVILVSNTVPPMGFCSLAILGWILHPHPFSFYWKQKTSCEFWGNNVVEEHETFTKVV